jgi:F0F1-type ATP synthase membrane subunit b/b'
MKTTHATRIILPSFLFALILLPWSVQALETSPAAGQSQPQAQQQPENPNAAIGEELSKASHEAAESEEHVENAQFKYSPTVQWLATHLGTDAHRAYFVSLVINFGLLALFFYILLRSKIPAMFRDRTASIQKAIREAQAASAEATQRLNGIEARLARLDKEIAEIRADSERQAGVEEERIRAAAEEDKRKVVESAKAEIDAASRRARGELKSYAASLAIDLAAKRIRVDERSDEALVRDFVDHLGEDGR